VLFGKATSLIKGWITWRSTCKIRERCSESPRAIIVPQRDYQCSYLEETFSILRPKIKKFQIRGLETMEVPISFGCSWKIALVLYEDQRA
jgi:hypothetical protein